MLTRFAPGVGALTFTKVPWGWRTSEESFTRGGFFSAQAFDCGKTRMSRSIIPDITELIRSLPVDVFVFFPEGGNMFYSVRAGYVVNLPCYCMPALQHS